MFPEKSTKKAETEPKFPIMPAKNLRSVIAQCSFVSRRNFSSIADPPRTTVERMVYAARVSQWIAGGYVAYAVLGAIEYEKLHQRQLEKLRTLVMEKRSQM